MIIIYMFTRFSFLGTCYIGDSKCFFLVSRFSSRLVLHTLSSLSPFPFPFPLCFISYSFLVFYSSLQIVSSDSCYVCLTFVQMYPRARVSCVLLVTHPSITRWLLPALVPVSVSVSVSVYYTPSPLHSSFSSPSSARKDRKEGKREKEKKEEREKGEWNPRGGVLYTNVDDFYEHLNIWIWIWTFESESNESERKFVELWINLGWFVDFVGLQ